MSADTATWRVDPNALRGRIAVVAGATRGAGRGIAAAFFTDIDGSRPDVWRSDQAVESGDRDTDPNDYR